MKDGYYLSTYLLIDPLLYVYHLNIRHDQNIALWKKTQNNVELVHYWELERITGFKGHNKTFYNFEHAKRFINSLLIQYNLALDDMEEIWGTPGLDTTKDYHTLYDYPEHAYHSMSHIFSALLMDTEKFYHEDFICLAVDGGPDEILDKEVQRKQIFTGCVSKKGEISFFHIPSPGPLWFLAKHYFNYREGTLMALANATTSQLHKQIDLNIRVKSFDDMAKLNIEFQKSLEKKKENMECLLNLDPRYTKEDNYISAFMKQIQLLSIKMMTETVDTIIQDYSLDPIKTNLALAGGFSLNCPTNTYLLKHFGFKSLFVPPCVNDGGISLGVGLYAFYKKMHTVHFKFKNAYYGDDDKFALKKLNEMGDEFIESILPFDKNVFLSDIMDEPIIWFSGRAEIGPRSLGNRSILGDPRKIETKDLLNKIKKRQWWRPVAPIVLTEYTQEWFDNKSASPYMLNTYTILSEMANRIPAVSHLDHSARIQSLEYENNPSLYNAIQVFYENTGVPMLCNTSLNDAGEPIINTIEEAYNFALRKQIKVMYVNSYRVKLKNFSNFLPKQPAERKASLMIWLTPQQENDVKKRLNPFGLSEEEIMIYLRLHELNQSYDICQENDVTALRKVIKKLLKSKTIVMEAFVNI